MELRLLGPIELWFGDRRVDAGPAKQRCVLAILGISAGTEVATDTLIDRVWGDTPPAGVRNVLYTHIARLKRLMSENMPTGPAVPLRRSSGGYVLDMERDQVDAHVFETAVASAQSAGTDGQRRTTLHGALQLWRGTPMSGITGYWANSARTALERIRASAFVELADVQLRAGVIAPEFLEEIRALFTDHPFDERLGHRLMLALCRGNRTAEALKLYEELRRRLYQELGHEPSPELQRLHRQILRQDPALTVAAPSDSATAKTPRQLPIAPGTFVGRAAELDTATLSLTAEQRHTPPIVAIHGAGGVGKSALALRIAHAVAGGYPDGQLYIDLRGSSPGVNPMSPLEALSRFLRTLGVPTAEVPGNEDEAAARFRSLIAQRRLLIVLDNAIDAAQVRWLLPADKGSGVVVTSRTMLSALGDATHLGLDVLRPDESTELLTKLDATQRLAADRSQASQIAGLCGHLPLALRIAAARLNGRPQWSIATFIENLSDEQHRLDRLGHDDLSLRACFQASYQVLAHGDEIDQEAARAFRFLGLPDGPDISLPIAARLLHAPEPQAGEALDRLIDTRLLESPAPGRYRMHDLVRLYAREVAVKEIKDAERLAALRRIWRCYIATVLSANDILRPGFREGLTDINLVHAVELGNPLSATAWMENECENLLAAARQAASVSEELATTTTELAHALFGFMHGGVRWKDLKELNTMALKISRDRADTRAEGQILSDLGVMAWRSGHGDEAIGLFDASVQIHRNRRDLLRQAMSLYNLGNAYSERGEHRLALECLDESLSLYRQTPHLSGEARTLNTLASVNRRLGHLELSTEQIRKSLAIYIELGDVLGEGNAERHLGDVSLEAHKPHDAISHYRRAVAMHRGSALPARTAWILADLGEAYRRVGGLRQAREVCEEALELSGRVGAQQEHGRALWRLGCVLADLGENVRAQKCWRTALPIFERLGSMEKAEVAGLLGESEGALSGVQNA